MSLHPAFEAYLAELNPLIIAARAAGVESTPESARAALAGLNQYALPAVEVAQVFDSAVEYDDGVETVRVPVRVYVPAPGEPRDVVFFVHGGGHMAGDLDVYDFSARRVAAATGMVTVSVDYRRSPEARFPLGLTDAYHVLRSLDDLLSGVATTGRVNAVADSGGAAKLASIEMRVAAGDWASPIARQVLIYPSLDYTLSGDSFDAFGQGYFLEAARVAWYFDQYFSDGDDRVAASPVTGPFSADMPETLVIPAEYDPLLSEAEAYVAGMRAAGAPAELVVAEGMIHAFAFFEALVTRDAERLYELIAQFFTDGTVGTWN